MNGDDVLEMREATQKAVERARKTKMPFFLEAKTYRFRGHSMSDPAKYRTREEVDQWMQRDPLAILAARIETLGIGTPEQLAAIDGEVKAAIQDAVEFAENSPLPDLEHGARPCRSLKPARCRFARRCARRWSKRWSATRTSS